MTGVSLLEQAERRVAKRKGGAKIGARGAVTALNLGEPTHMTFQPADFDQLELDRDYQREEVRDLVANIIQTLKAGGEIAQPITVVRRKFRKNGELAISKKYFIVDGQQRTWASLEVGIPIKAICYEVETYEAERSLFVQLNTRRQINANTWLAADNGPTAEFLRAISREGHIAHGRISFKTDRTKLIAATVVNGLARLYNCKHGAISREAKYLDPMIAADPNKARVFVELLVNLFDGMPGYNVIAGIALVCQKKWNGDAPTLPSKAAMARMKKINWETIASSNATDTQMLVSERALRSWK